MSIRITRIIEGQDMRGVHKLRAKKIKKGECLVAFNKSKNIARIVDCLHGVHTYYTDPGVIFDINTIRDLCYNSFYIDISVGKTVRKKHLRRVA